MKYINIVVILFILHGCGSGASEDKNIGQENDLPEMAIQLTDGSFRQIDRLQSRSILVLFQPGCDHCQRQADDIRANLESFSDYQMYFISNSAISELRNFANTYGLDEAPNIHFGLTDASIIVEKFGSVPTPSLYIYSENGNLQNEFIGETPIEEIIAVL